MKLKDLAANFNLLSKNDPYEEAGYSLPIVSISLTGQTFLSPSHIPILFYPPFS